MSDSNPHQQQLELFTTRCVGIASFTILVWDHLLTLPDEVQFIWKRKKKGALVWLFFVNRYLTPFAFSINLFAYFFTGWTYTMCRHFVRYEGSMTVVGINTSALMMLIRIYAMYRKKKAIVVMLTVVFAVELGTNIWLLTYGIPVPHNPLIQGCSMIFDPTRVPAVAAAASAWLPLLYDTMVLVLTVRCTYREAKHPTAGHTMRVLLKEGVWYYSVIFAVTFVLTMMIAFAPDGVKNVAAQTEYLMTVAMMSRITLHLKKDMESPRTLDPLCSRSTYDLTSSFPPRDHVTPISFAPWNQVDNAAAATSPMSISIQEHCVTHDDRGRELQLPKKSRSPVHAKKDSWAGNEEWIEFVSVSSSETSRREVQRIV